MNRYLRSTIMKCRKIMLDCKELDALDSELCGRARLEQIDGTVVFDRCYYADISGMQREPIVESYFRRVRYRSDDDVDIRFKDTPLAVVSEAIRIKIGKEFGSGALFGSFSCGYCQRKLDRVGPGIGSIYGIRLFEISIEDFEAIRY